MGLYNWVIVQLTLSIHLSSFSIVDFRVIRTENVLILLIIISTLRSVGEIGEYATPAETSIMIWKQKGLEKTLYV